jgi:hypothetical protein
MAQSPQFNDSQNSLLAKIAANTGESQPKVGDGQHNLLFKIAQNTYASAVTSSPALQASGDGYVLAQQGDNIAEKYSEAKAKSPSVTNRITLFIVPGTYPLSSELAIDAEFVDLVGLGAQFQSPAVIVSNNTLNVTANDVRVSGISVGAQEFKIADNKPLQVFENCTGGVNSFNGSDGTGENVYGSFYGCIGGEQSFGSLSFYGNCFNCIGGSFSFGRDGGVMQGELISCRITGGGSGGSYETPTGSGIIRFCLDGDNNIVNADAP